MEYTSCLWTAVMSVRSRSLERECFSAPWSEAMLTEALFDAQASFIVAESEDGGLLATRASMWCWTRLHRQHRCGPQRPPPRRGGRAAGCVLPVGAANLAFLTLEVRASNAPAIALYRKHGFQEAGRRKDYYRDPTEDALLLTRTFVR